LKRKKLLLSILTLVLLLLAAGGAAVAFLFPDDDHVARGVLLAGVNVGSMTRHDAKAKVAPVLDSLLANEIHWRYEERSWQFTLKDMGMAFDLDGALNKAFEVGRNGAMPQRARDLVWAASGKFRLEPALLFGQPSARDTLTRLAQLVSREPADASLTLQGDDVLVQPEKSGTELDMDTILQQLQEIARTGKPGDYILPVKLKRPTVTASDLQGFNCVLGGFSTSFAGSSSQRSHNIAVAAGALNGTLIAPGQVFSFNAIVGPRSSETGYKTAPIYQGGKVVPGIGGGVCQVSSTTYNALLLSGFDIVQRSNHAMPVHYLPPGRDATVVYGAIDLKARNPYPNPAYLMAGVTGKTVWVKVLGDSADKPVVSLSSEVTGDIPFSIIEKEDPSLPPGKTKVDQKGSNGKTSVAYRKIKRPGQPEKTEVLSRDSYRPMNKIILVGPKPPANAPAPPPQEAPSDNKEQPPAENKPPAASPPSPSKTPGG